MKIFNKHIGRSAACLLIAAAMLPAVLPANAETLYHHIFIPCLRESLPGAGSGF